MLLTSISSWTCQTQTNLKIKCCSLLTPSPRTPIRVTTTGSPTRPLEALLTKVIGSSQREAPVSTTLTSKNSWWITKKLLLRKNNPKRRARAGPATQEATKLTRKCRDKITQEMRMETNQIIPCRLKPTARLIILVFQTPREAILFPEDQDCSKKEDSIWSSLMWIWVHQCLEIRPFCSNKTFWWIDSEMMRSCHILRASLNSFHHSKSRLHNSIELLCSKIHRMNRRKTLVRKDSRATKNWSRPRSLQIWGDPPTQWIWRSSRSKRTNLFRSKNLLTTRSSRDSRATRKSSNLTPWKRKRFWHSTKKTRGKTPRWVCKKR